jgi:hypothetical protein
VPHAAQHAVHCGAAAFCLPAVAAVPLAGAALRDPLALG